ncbi:hypothetical protein E4U26_002156 [Claviceps purpurea]|nr:hypothetical protein E4U26_002156 [Claviceps purpurea]
MAAIHKQQQADQRTKLNRGRRMPHRAFPQMYMSSILRSGGMNNTAMAPVCLGRRPVATYQNWRRRHRLYMASTSQSSQSSPVVTVDAQRQGFLVDNVVLRNHASNLDLPAGSLIPRGERPPGL